MSLFIEKVFNIVFHSLLYTENTNCKFGLSRGEKNHKCHMVTRKRNCRKKNEGVLNFLS